MWPLSLMGALGKRRSAVVFEDTLSWRRLQVSGEDSSTGRGWGVLGRGSSLSMGVIKLCFWNFTLCGERWLLTSRGNMAGGINSTVPSPWWRSQLTPRGAGRVLGCWPRASANTSLRMAFPGPLGCGRVWMSIGQGHPVRTRPFHPRGRSQPLESHRLDSNPDSASSRLCGLGCDPDPLCAVVAHL